MTKKISDKELAKLAVAVGAITTKEKARMEGAVEGWSFLGDPSVKDETGFKAATYKNNITGEVVVVYGGTDDAKDLLFNDTVIALNKTVPQATEAIEYYNKVIAKNKEVTVTGHSLGGALTDYVAYYAATTLGDNTTQFTTFNAPGVLGNKFNYDGRSYTVETNGGILSNVDEFRINGEPIGGYGEKLGNDICLDRIRDLSVEEITAFEFIAKKYPMLFQSEYGQNFWAKYYGHTMEEYLDANRWGKNNEMLGECVNPQDVNYKNAIIYWLGTGTDWGMAWDGMDVLHPFGDASTLQPIDPIVLDLNGDGITFGSATDGYAQFDMDNNGFKERVAWLNNSDGFLARDINGNSLIDNGSEMFGDGTVLKNGKIAASGYEALRDLDDNKDGVLDKLDKAFASLKIWRDKDGDGITDDGELGPLADLGITGINLSNKAVNKTDENNNTLNSKGSYTKGDGSEGTMGEYSLSRDTVHSEAASASNEEYSNEIEAAPNLAGQGNVVDLRRAMAEDKTGVLYDYVQKFITATTESERINWLDKILFKWTGTENVNKSSRGSYTDAQKLETLEKLYGQDFVNVDGERNPNAPNIWAELNNQYVSIRDKAYVQLAMQTFAKDVCDKLRITYDAKSGKCSMDVTGVQEYIDQQLQSNEEGALNSFKNILAVVSKMGWQDEMTELATFVQHFKVQNSNMEFFATVFSHNLNFLEMADSAISAKSSAERTAILGNKEDNAITGSSADDVLYGGDGNDRLYGSAGNDILTGGLGDDYLQGGHGQDTYIWNKGDGNDTIDAYNYYSINHSDVLKIGDGISKDDMTVLRDGYNLVLKYKATGEKITVKDWFSGSYNWLNKVAFADGSELTGQELTDLAEVRGTSGNDQLRVTGNYPGKIYGEAGEDSLYGSYNGDIMVGGLGDDNLQGGHGQDTYIWNKGDGNDTIDAYNYYSINHSDVLKIGDGISKDDMTVLRDGYNLVLKYKATGEKITVKDWFSGSYNWLNKVAFADGSELTGQELTDLAEVRGTSGNDQLRVTGNYPGKIYGEAGKDSLYGSYNGDIMVGGLGDDYLQGGHGQDTYIWNKGDGNDTIDAYNYYSINHSDVLKIGDGISKDDMTVLRDGYNLVLKYKATGEKITVKDWFSGSYNWLNKVAFADGSELTGQELTDLAEVRGTSGNDQLRVTGNYPGKIYGEAGKDSLYGSYNGDIMVGGLGDDNLQGGHGQDTYIWNKGDGNDTIDAYNYYSSSNKDRLIMERINQAMLEFSMAGDDLICTYTPTNEFIKVQNWDMGDPYQLASIECADGSLLAGDINKKTKIG